MLQWIHVPQAWRVYLATGLDFREKNRVFLGSLGTRLWLQLLTLPLYYEGKLMKTSFPQNYVYVLRTTKTLHMVSFIDFYFHFQQIFRPKLRQSRAQSSPAPRSAVGRRGELWGHEKNMIFLIGSQ